MKGKPLEDFEQRNDIIWHIWKVFSWPNKGKVDSQMDVILDGLIILPLVLG